MGIPYNNTYNSNSEFQTHCQVGWLGLAGSVALAAAMGGLTVALLTNRPPESAGVHTEVSRWLLVGGALVYTCM